MTSENQPLNVHEAAEYLGCHAQTVRRLARKGELPGYKVGQDWRFRREALDKWMESQWQPQQKVSVLIVDDEPAVRDSSCALLEQSGYAATTAADGEEALSAMRDSLPDVVLLDLVMPDMNGPEILAEIRKRHGNVPVIILTGYPDGKLINEALVYGPLLVLAKPARREHLLNAIETAVAQNRT